MSRENTTDGASGRMALEFERQFAYQPPSPTLTNPDMILPDAYPLPAQQNNPTSRLVESWRETKPTYENTARAVENFAKSHGGFVATGHISPSIHVRPSSPLSAIQEVETTPRRPYLNGAYASSPTYPQDALLRNPSDWNLSTPRRLSNASSSALSEDLENIKWFGFDSATETDESVLDEEDEAKLGYFPKPSGSDDGTETDWLGARGEDTHDDQDLLSRRADLILANAKKRLNLMEGNLKGARSSLQQPSSGRQSYTSSRQSLVSPRSNGTSGHSRAASEASASAAPAIPAPRHPKSLPKRASSALGSFAGGLNLLGRTPSLRAARSQEVMRENRLQTWILADQSHGASLEPPRPVSAVDTRTIRHSPTPSIESLQSSQSLRRPESRTSEIRAQMNELKGKISKIKERNDRGSTLGTRTPSPSVTSVSSGRRYLGTGRSPLSPSFPPDALEANSNGSPVPPTPNHISPHGEKKSFQDLKSEYAESHYEDAEETLDEMEEDMRDTLPSNGVTVFSPMTPDAYFEDATDDESESESRSLSGQTEYFEAETVAHEDRADAFDYEHFFLHSAMGSYSRDRRRDSFSSDDSVETTRPASPLRQSNGETGTGSNSPGDEVQSPRDSAVGLHRRSQSVESFSSTATFETAAEDYNDNTDDEFDDMVDEDELDAVTRSLMISAVQPTASDSSLASPTMSPRHSLAPSTFPTSELPPSPPINRDGSTRLSGSRPASRRPSSALISSFIGLDSMAASPDIVHRDRVLVESVVQALQRCCLQLQRAQTLDGKRDMWRERLMEARKVLDGA